PTVPPAAGAPIQGPNTRSPKYLFIAGRLPIGFRTVTTREDPMSRRALPTAARVAGLAFAGTLMAPAAAEAAAPASGARLVLTIRAPHTTLHAVLTCEP